MKHPLHEEPRFSLIPLAVFLLVFPWFLSRRNRVVRRGLVKAAPAEVFPYLNDLRNWPVWTEWSRKEEIDFDYSGPPAGIGATQHWKSRRMDGVVRITQSVQDDHIGYQLEMEGGKYRMNGVIALEPAGAMTRVTWLCRWQGNPNPYLRYLDLLMKWWIGRDFEAGLENLRQIVQRRP
jgi:hypothetical protein